MTTSLLTTKLYIPPSRPGLVSRPRLLHKLDEGLRLGRRLMLISAPAGYGKTTLVSAWLHSVNRSPTWFSLDEGDNYPVHFFSYLVAALRKVEAPIVPAA